MAVTSKLILMTVLLAASQAHGATCANTVTSGFEWDYPVASLPFIDGFNFYINGTKKASVDAGAQTILCSTLGLTANTQYTAEVSAYNAMGESARSTALPFAFVTAVPAVKPGGLRAK